MFKTEDLEKEKLFGKTVDEIKAIVKKYKLGIDTPRKIYTWLYRTDISCFDEMTDIDEKAISILKENFDFGLTSISNVQTSIDGTKKYLFSYSDNKYVETAYIPEEDRATLCISSQVGCKMGCEFCMTAKQGFQCNLTANQILNQIRSIPERKNITNIVFMGMGEPFDNTEEVFKALNIILDQRCFAVAAKRVTVSTIGVLPGIKRLFEDTSCQLAISLHNAFPEERKLQMPVENAYSINDIRDYLLTLTPNKQQKVFFEYILFKGINDTIEHAQKLSEFLDGLKCKVNLIKFHPIPNSKLESSDPEVMEQFRNYLSEKGVVTTFRKSRGEDILAACGMLSTREQVGK